MVALRLEDREPATLSGVELASYAALSAAAVICFGKIASAALTWRPREHLLQVYSLQCMLL